jgi:hypothetical protein
VAFDSGTDVDPVTTIAAIDLLTGQRRMLAEGTFQAVGSDNGYAFWRVYEPNVLRGYDLKADRVFQLNLDDNAAQVHAEQGIVVQVREYDVVTHAIADLPGASDSRWWQRNSNFLIGVLVLAAFAAGSLLYVERVPAQVAGQPARGIGVATTPNDELPHTGVRWAGLAGIAGGVLTIGTGMFAAVRPFTLRSEYAEEFEPSASVQERMVMVAVLLLILIAVSGLQARQHTCAGATGWVGYAIALSGTGLILATLLDLRDGWGGVLLGVLLLGVGLMTLGSATIDGEAPVRWRPAALLLGLLTIVALPVMLLFGGDGSIFAISPFLWATGVIVSMLGYSVATQRPADLDG